MPKLNFPNKYDFKITKNGAENYLIWDKVRKKNLVLTPEEWVRQHFVEFLLKNEISPSQILLEKEFPLYQIKKRIDIVVMKKNKPIILIELKAPQIDLTEEHFEQVARYNIHFQAENIILSNGLRHISMQKNENDEYEFLPNELDLFGGIFAK